ncbi:MAG: hypothetical protein II956_10115 [Bacteroidales bacterium]|nr:hypothetical protein [Bacteroidales bacterium]
MRNFILRKQIVNISNQTVDEFLQRVVKASDSLKNNAFSKYVSTLKTSAKAFNETRGAAKTSNYTPQIKAVALELDGYFKKIRTMLDYAALCKSGQEQSEAEKIKLSLKVIGNVPRTGIKKKVADYETLISALKPQSKTLTSLGLETCVTEMEKLIAKFREYSLSRDNDRAAAKGKSLKARNQALEDYSALRNYVEAYSVINGDKDTASFISLVNETLIYLMPKTSK